MPIDLNCDMGESFGSYHLGNDEAILSLVTSANVACGFHAGDPQVMQDSVSLAVKHHVAVGAHPGFPDLVGFGRRSLDATMSEIENDVLYQIGALYGFARAANAPLVHVKAHGALYNSAATNPEIAQAIARAVKRFDAKLILVGLANSTLVDVARDVGLKVAREGFCDRAYTPSGQLQSRRVIGAVITDPSQAAAQAVQLASKQSVTTTDGSIIPMLVDTLCIHGDTPNAIEIAREVRGALQKSGIEIAPPNR